jgi:hypothetical protein
MIVSGNENGIAFDPEQGELEYLYMHSHPENLGASAEDYMSLYNLNQSKQVIVKPNGEVQIRKPVANESGEIVNQNNEIVGDVEDLNTVIEVKNGIFTPVTFRGKTYLSPDSSRINLANGPTDFTPLKANGEFVKAGWDHIVDEHFVKVLSNNKSIFTISQGELKIILQSPIVISSPITEVQPGIYYVLLILEK